MSKINYGKNMMLFTGYWGQADTIKMMPVTEDCPFMEVIYDPNTTLLVVIGKAGKQNFQFVEKLDSEGDPIPSKRPQGPQSRSPYKQERTKMEVKQEYYIGERDEQIDFIERFAVNADTYDYLKFLRDLTDEKNAVTLDVPEQRPLLDENGQPLKDTKKSNLKIEK